MGCSTCGGNRAGALSKIFSAARKLVHGAAGVAKAELGWDPAPPEVVEQRRAACRACPLAVRCRSDPAKVCWCGPAWDGVWGRRETCGCSIKHKTRVAGERCPTGQWDAVPPDPKPPT